MDTDPNPLEPPTLSRRGFLLAGLAGALGVTAAGTTAVLAQARPSWAADRVLVDVTGDYSLVDATTGTEVVVTVRNGVRRIRANGLPNHGTGRFPNAHNPNTISAQSYDFSLPVRPERADVFTPYDLPQPFGIAVNGVLFDPLANEFWRGDRASGWQYDALGGGIDLGLDTSNAHVQPTGAYHYHGVPTGLASSLPSRRHGPLVGWAGDGFPIYLARGYRKATDPSSGVVALTPSYALRRGTRAGGPGGDYDGTYVQDWRFVRGRGDLDKANGRYGVTPEYPKGTYYYVLTDAFPMIPRRFAGTLAPSFARTGPPAGPR